MISIEAHRAAIGRFTGKARVIKQTNTINNVQWIDTALLIFFMILLQIILYSLLVTTTLTLIFIPYHIILLLIFTTANNLSNWFRKKSKLQLMRNSSPPKGVKVHALIPSTYLDTFVLDGRCNLDAYFVLDGGTILDFVLGGGDGKIRIIAQRLNDKVTNYLNTTKAILHHLCKMDNFKMSKVYAFICLTCLVLFLNYISSDDTHSSNSFTNGYNKTTISDIDSYNVSFLKLAQLLIDGDVESNPGPVTNIVETPKGKGRPKKSSKGFKGKPKKLDFTSAVTDNRFMKHQETIQIQDIKPWDQICKSLTSSAKFEYMPELNRKVSYIQGDIVKLKVDSIVNAAKCSLLGGGGIDGVIHKAAGIELKRKCEKITPEINSDTRCRTGQCKVTDTIGCNLLCEYVFHTVGPKVEDINLMDKYKNELKQCYENCLLNMLEYNVKSIVFPCISTSIYRFDNREAAHIALNTVRTWLEVNHMHIQQIIFCTYENEDFKLYEEIIPEYFPTSKSVVKKDSIIPDVTDITDTAIIPENPGEDNIPSTSGFIVSNDHVPITSDIINRNFPVRLMNSGVNACFFNSLCQVLYTFPMFLASLKYTPSTNNVVNAMQEVFAVMKNSHTTELYDYIRQIKLRDYRFEDQYDVQEAFIQILDNIYPETNEKLFEKSPFGIKLNAAIHCEYCEYRKDISEIFQTIAIDVLEDQHQSLKGLLNVVLTRTDTPNEYFCERCENSGVSTKTYGFDQANDIIALQLSIFSYDQYGNSWKKSPSIEIEKDISVFEDYSLQGIIWHHGENLNSGHYTATVKHNENWYHISDNKVSYDVKFSCNAGDDMVPYLLFYSKNISGLSNNERMVIENADIETNPGPVNNDDIVHFRIHDSTYVCAKKRTIEENIENNDFSLAKKKKSDEVFSEDGIINEKLELCDESQLSDKEKCNDNNVEKKFNFSGKRKRKFSDIRSTPEGRKKHNESERKANEEIRSTN